MKSPNASKSSSRVRNRKRSVKISSTEHRLTSQAGLIPVVKYLDRIGFEKTVKQSVAHPRGDNAVSDVVLLILVGMIGGVASMAKVTTVWTDSVGLGKIRTDQFLDNAALFHCAVLAYNTVRWMAQLSGNKTLCQWEPDTIRTYLVRVAEKLFTGNNQLRVKAPADPLYPQEWDDWVKGRLISLAYQLKNRFPD